MKDKIIEILKINEATDSNGVGKGLIYPGAYKDIATELEQLLSEPKATGVIRNDRIVDKNIHPSTVKASGMSAEEWIKENKYSPDNIVWEPIPGQMMGVSLASVLNHFASTGREKEGEKIPTVIIEFKPNYPNFIMEEREYKEYNGFFKFCCEHSIDPKDVKKVHHILLKPENYPTTTWEG